MPIFQCYSATLGSASVKSELCPFILHLYMKNVTAKKIQLSCIFTRQTDCVAKENRFKGEFNLNLLLSQIQLVRALQKLIIRSLVPTYTVI